MTRPLEIDSLSVRVILDSAEDLAGNEARLDALGDEVSDVLDQLAATARDRIRKLAVKHEAKSLRTENDRLVSA